jgi:branched-chain amino acid transport system permease protein
VRGYARDHLIHILVIAFFALYPGIYWHLAGQSESTGLWVLLLPSMTTMTELMFLGVFAMSFDFISGYTGYLSFGHSLFYGTGVFFVLGSRAGAFPLFGPETGFMTLLLVSMVVAFIIAFLLGLVSFRLTGVYFAMITLGFAEIAKLIVLGYVGDSGLTGAGQYGIGLPFVDSLQLTLGQFATTGSVIHLHEVPVLGAILGVVGDLPGFASVIASQISLTPQITSFYLIAIVALAAYFIMQRIIHSPFGRVMIAIRENEERASAIGYNTFWYKIVAFSFSAAFAAVGGALAAAFRNAGDATRDLDVITMAGDALLATIIGGIGTLAGPFYGFLFDLNLAEFFGGKGGSGLVSFLRNSFSGLVDSVVAFEMTVGDYLNTIMQGHSELYIGIMFILFVLYVPGGLLGVVRLLLGGKLSKAFPDWLGRRF